MSPSSTQCWTMIIFLWKGYFVSFGMNQAWATSYDSTLEVYQVQTDYYMQRPITKPKVGIYFDPLTAEFKYYTRRMVRDYCAQSSDFKQLQCQGLLPSLWYVYQPRN